MLYLLLVNHKTDPHFIVNLHIYMYYLIFTTHVINNLHRVSQQVEVTVHHQVTSQLFRDQVKSFTTN